MGEKRVVNLGSWALLEAEAGKQPISSRKRYR